VSAAAHLLEVRDLRVRKGGADLLDLPALNVAAWPMPPTGPRSRN
jgi:hypothetical protein